jgi:hypothetical protein
MRRCATPASSISCPTRCPLLMDARTARRCRAKAYRRAGWCWSIPSLPPIGAASSSGDEVTMHWEETLRLRLGRPPRGQDHPPLSRKARAATTRSPAPARSRRTMNSWRSCRENGLMSDRDRHPDHCARPGHHARRGCRAIQGPRRGRLPLARSAQAHHDLVLGNTALLADLTTPRWRHHRLPGRSGQTPAPRGQYLSAAVLRAGAQAGGLAEPILRGVYDDLPRMFDPQG